MKATSLDIPIEFDGYTLYGWLGTFWTQMCSDHELARAYSNGQGLLSLQMYIDFLETIGMLTYDKCPVFHRSRWMPLMVRKSERGTGKAVSFKVGMEPPVYVGSQPENSGYQYGAVYKVGGYAQPRSFVSYPIHASVSSVASCICDTIVNPSVILVNGKDFYVESDTLLIKGSSDIFDDPRFARRIVTNSDGTTDEEIVLWAVDAMVDKDLLYTHFGYAVGVNLPSSEFYQKVLTSLWRLYVSGGPEAFLKACIASMVGIPAIVSDETVDEVITDFITNDMLVVTNKMTYRYPAGSIMSLGVEKGAILTAGAIPVETIKVFSKLTSSYIGGSRKDLEESVPIVHIPPSMLSVKVKFGIGAVWTSSPVTFNGLDANGNPKLSMPLAGDPGDIELFWEAIFSTFEKKGERMADLVSGVGAIDWTAVALGQVIGFSSPAMFIVDNFIGPNSVFVVIDIDHVASREAFASLSKIRNAIPIGTSIFMCMKSSVSPDLYDLSNNSAIVSGGTADSITYRYTGNQVEAIGVPGGLVYVDSEPVVHYKVICGEL